MGGGGCIHGMAYSCELPAEPPWLRLLEAGPAHISFVTHISETGIVVPEPARAALSLTPFNSGILGTATRRFSFALTARAAQATTGGRLPAGASTRSRPAMVASFTSASSAMGIVVLRLLLRTLSRIR